MPRMSVDLPTLGELPTIAAENNPNALAFADAGAKIDATSDADSDGEGNGESVTWAGFEERSLVAADAFQTHVRQGDRVAFLADSSVETTTLWSGALKAGAVVSYVHTKAAPETVRPSIDELRPEVLVVGAEFADFFAETVWPDLEAEPHVVVCDGAARGDAEPLDSFLAGAAPVAPDVAVSADDIAVVAWTSGTTGDPKGWCHTHRSIVLKGLSRKTGRGTRQLSSASTSFMAWYGHVVPNAIAGGSVVFLPDWTPTAWAEAVEAFDVTRAGMVPTMWRSILDLDLSRYDLSTLETATFVGEKMDRTTLNRLREQVCENVVNAYSSTEFTISTNTVEEMEGERIESVGKPADGTRVRIVEPGGEPEDTVPRGETGEILVKGADCPVWAWGRSDLLDEEFTDGWWHSGDLGYRDEDGYLFLKGRADFMIKSKGVKVFPGPIEECLNAHPEVDEAAVVGVEDETYGQKVTAVVTRGDDAVDSVDLDEWCLDSDEVARFERPREYVFVEDGLPRTPSRKLDRRALLDRLEDGQ